MHTDNTGGGLALLAACTVDVRLWYLQNGLQHNPEKSEVLVIGTSSQLQVATSNLSSVSVAGVDLPVAEKMKILGVVFNRRLSFDSHATTVARACNCHLRAIRHIRHLLSTAVRSNLWTERCTADF